MAKHLDIVPATLQRSLFVLLLWALILQAAIGQRDAPIATADKVYADAAARPFASTSNTPPESPTPPRTCNSIEVRTRKDFALLQNCTRVLGHVWLAHLQMTPNDVAARQFASTVTEISDYLLVHRVHGLRSLEQIFPHLQIIRGRQLLFDEFALVVYENRDLQDLGLKSLLRIQKGNIRIESNPSLCYVDTVNWVQLLGNSTQQHFWHKNNKLHNHCTQCARSTRQVIVEEDLPEKLRKHCWKFNMPQRRPATSNIVNCRSDCGMRGCDENGSCCDRNCLSGCDGTNCELCANLNMERQCVDACPQNYYQYQDRECISAAKCRQMGWIPHPPDSGCLETCPKNHLSQVDAKGQTYCKLLCAGKYSIHTADDFESLKGCITVNGSLTIELTDVKTKITDLDNALVNITEITGYLKVINSPQLLSLHFLRNLLTIRGEELIDDLYALYAVDNYHLSEIWTPNQNVAILKGSIYFHLNPRLCLNKIRQLEKSLKSARPITTVNVSPHSNGERVICSSPLGVLNVTVEDFNSTAVRLKIDTFTVNNIQIILGYVYYYKEAPIKNVTLYDGRHGCGHDSWRMDINPTKNVRYIISNLKPYTQYAYFAKTLTMTDYHIQVDAYSKIQYFRTLPSKPGPVRRVYYTAIAIDKIVLHWWPPHMPNGEIEKYLIYHEKVIIGKHNVTLGNHPEFLRYSSSCECVVINPEYSGPLPKDENYYNKDQIIYEETLPNLIFVSRKVDNRHVRREAKAIACNNATNCVDGKLSTTPNTISAFLDSTSKLIRPKRKVPDNTRKLAEKKNNNNLEDKTNKDDHDLEGDPNFMEAIRNFNKFREQQEEIALKMQDTGPDDFPIVKQRPVCQLVGASADYQLQNDCRAQEIFDGIAAPGDVHSYKLEGLEPDQTYRVTVRACVANLKNGCGVETSIFAETVSKSMEEFIEDLKALE
ncbi:PREDICTED: insulin receptor isoform X2 [Rhagoletis zephyria]|uniref:insulin receptor isoform X1 n=1 Tax=Rhagoletis zephyria TaxID=28612 RepID=UPI00081136A5|nr:PREDICTED: insulin receptor isoform X1 [Rhagoletis zephyria]XP_017486215.1 PREDICTED: insulin receptor isoform X2 [Rhagoletis zephyria]